MITCWATKQILFKFRKMEIILSSISEPNIRDYKSTTRKTCKKHKHVEVKQYATKKSIDH